LTEELLVQELLRTMVEVEEVEQDMAGKVGTLPLLLTVVVVEVEVVEEKPGLVETQLLLPVLARLVLVEVELVVLVELVM
jgi:hypothetical protein